MLKTRILVVEDDEALNTQICEIIKGPNTHVESAGNGMEAIEKLNSQKFDLVISDIRMPAIDGFALARHVKTHFSIPVILMSGFGELMDIQRSHEVGCCHFLAKPFEIEELLNAIALITSNTPDSTQPLDEEFCRIPAGEFISGSQLKVDIYLRLNQSKYLKIAVKGARIQGDQLRNYISKGLRYLYIKKDEFPLYVGVNLRVSRVATQRDSLSIDQKLKLLKHTGESLLQDTFINGVTKEKHDEAREVVMNTIRTLTEDGDIAKLLLLLNEHSDHIYAHCLAVSVYSTLIGKEVGWGSTSSQFKISMAGMLHDLGKKELPLSVLDKPRQDLSIEELKLLETHTIRGKNLLSHIANIPSDIAIVASQHHENLIGRGFPNRLKKEQIHPLARLIGVTDGFIDLVMKTPFYEGMDSNEAFDRLLAINSNEYEPVFLAGLMKVFNYPLPSHYVQVLKQANKMSA